MVIVEYQVGADADDGYWSAGDFYGIGPYLCIGPSATVSYRIWARWPTVIIPDGAVINSAYLRFYRYNSDAAPAECDLYFEDTDNPDAPTSESNANGKPKTTATIKITSPTSGTWWDSGDIKTIIQELVDSYSYADGAAMQAIVISPASDGTSRLGIQRSSTYPGDTSGPILHIEYIPGGGPAIPIVADHMRRRVT